MRNTRKLYTLFLSLLVAFSSFASLTATADPIKYPNVSNVTPNRASIEYKNNDDGTPPPGLPYSSFNNFDFTEYVKTTAQKSKPAPLTKTFNYSEKEFLVGTLCKGGTCTIPSTYYNTLPANNDAGLQEGDTMRFAVYVHNNGEDPYLKSNGKYAVSPDATNVKVGVQFSGEEVKDKSYPEDFIRPIGYIEADNNVYKNCTSATDKKACLYDQTSANLKDSKGNDIHKATDDMGILLAEKGLELKPTTDRFWYRNKNADGFTTQSKIGKTEITFKADNTQKEVKVNATTHYDENTGKMWVEFDRLPGCFRYSGFVYFDVKVVKKQKPEPPASICSELKITKTEINEPKLQPQTSYKISAKPTFSPDTKVPDNTQIKWSTTDNKGKFWKRIEMAVPGKYKYSDITDSTESNPETLANPDEEIYYTGYGKVSAKLTGIDAKLIGETCIDNFALTPPPVCTKLEVNYPKTITVGVISDLMAKATVTQAGKESDFVGQIKYWVDDQKDGRFYSAPPSEYPYMNQPYNIASFGYTGKLQEDKKQASQTGSQDAIIAQKTWTHFVGINAVKKNIHIQAYDPTGLVDVSKCKLDLPIAPAPRCQEISINKHSTITEGQVTEFSAIGKDKIGKTFNGKVTYSVPAEYGTFYTDPNDADVKAAKANTSQFIKQYDETKVGDLSAVKPQDGDFCENPVQLPKDLAPTIIGNPNTIPKALDIILGQMYGTIPLQSIQDILDIGKSDQNTSDSVNPLNPNGETTQPNPGATNIFGAFSQGKLTQADKTKISGLNGKILQVKAGKQQKGSTIVVDPNTKVYFVPKKGKSGKQVVSLSINCSSCSTKFDIISVPKEIPIVCKSLIFTSNGTTIPPNSPALQTNKDQSLALSLNTKDNQGNPLPSNTGLNLLWNTNGIMADSKGNKNTDTGKFSTTIDKLPLIFSGAEKDGQITATVDKSSPLYSEKCKADISILKPEIPPEKPEEPLTCKEISVRDVDTNQSPSLAPNGIYQVRAKTQYSKTVIANNIFAVKQEMGVVVSMSSNPLIKSLQLVVLNDLRLSENLTAEGKLKTLFTLLPSQTVADGQTAYFVTYSDVKISDPKALEVKAEKFSTPADCDKFFPLTYTPPTPKPEPTCDALSIVAPAGTWTADGMTIDPFEIKVTTTPANKEGEFTYTWETDKTGTWNDTGKKTDSAVGTLTNTLKNAEGGTMVKVQAWDKTGKVMPQCLATITANPAPPPTTIKAEPKPEKPTICQSLNIKTPKSPWIADKSKQLFEIDVSVTPKDEEKKLTYIWKVTDKKGTWSNGKQEERTKGSLSLKNSLKNAEDGTSIEVYAEDEDGNKIEECSDTINAKTLRSPVMTKSVYPTSTKPSNTTKDILNIGASSNKKLVTYKIQFKANSAEKVDISESTMKNGTIKGDKNGRMEYKGMIINATEGTDSDAKRTLLKDGTYQTETEDTAFTGHNFKLENLQQQHNCDNGNEKNTAICIDNSNFESVVNRFKDGYAIPFKNIKTNLKNTVIEIKVQMEITSTIDETACKGLSTADGCGEEFNNNAKFKATMINDTKENDSVSAKVIVICPYVLTRQAGDVFFYDALSTGVDVSRCSEVKSTPGLVIQPEKIQRNKVTSTGSGDLPEEAKFLEVPSHDICRYSNTNTNVKGYDDILKNFSSTICEMRAEVAETWKEAYINNAINANVERISRFGKNLINQYQTISSMTDLQDIDNAQSGVFVKEGGTLTIGGNQAFEISSFASNGVEKVPAGQTYIIKGGTLHIKSDIKYGETDYSNPKKIPSAAFIVIDGNIIIDNNVGQIDAIVMAVDTDESGDGKITNRGQGDTDRRLVINGSLIGNVAELFKTRTGAGDPTRDEGAVTVRYDERILLNTPPGLSDLLNITQSLIPG